MVAAASPDEPVDARLEALALQLGKPSKDLTREQLKSVLLEAAPEHRFGKRKTLPSLPDLVDAVLDVLPAAPPRAGRVKRRAAGAEPVARGRVATRPLLSTFAASSHETSIALSRLPPPSVEQAEIVAAVVAGDCNVRVNAVAGSGKTSTVLHCAARLSGVSCLLLTYNKRLKSETREKAEALDLPHLTVHNYHAAVIALYGGSGLDDTGMRRVVEQDLAPIVCFAFERIFVDEVQDMKPLHHAFLCKLLRDNAAPACPLLLLGDEKQELYGYTGADARFLTQAHRAMPASPLRWRALSLQTSYRLTPCMATFLNHCVFGFPKLLTVPGRRIGSPVQYWQGNNYNIVKDVADDLATRIRAKTLQASDIFVLAPSVKSGNVQNQAPVNELINRLVKEHGVPCFAAGEDTGSLTDDIIAGKVVCSSFHQAKGLERKVVVVLSFSETFYWLFKDDPRAEVPNLLYVAATRAMEQLILVGHDTKDGQLPFLRSLSPCAFLDVKSKGFLKPAVVSEAKPANNYSPSVRELTSHLPEAVMTEAMSHVKYRTVEKATVNIPVPLSVPSTKPGLLEDVTELNGLAVPAMYEELITKKPSTLYVTTVAGLEGVKEAVAYRAELQLQPKGAKRTAADDLRLATINGFVTGGFLVKVEQIKERDWLSEQVVQQLFGVLAGHLPLAAQPAFEQSMKHKEKDLLEGGIFNIKGTADVVTADTIYELKCVSELTQEHLLQTVAYKWLWNVLPAKPGRLCRASDGPRGARLLNFRTGQTLEVTCSDKELQAVMKVLLRHRMTAQKRQSDEEFVAACATRH